MNFLTDTKDEQALFMELCREMGVDCVLTSVWKHGSRGGIALAEKVVELCENNATFQPTYDMSATIQEKSRDDCEERLWCDKRSLFRRSPYTIEGIRKTGMEPSECVYCQNTILILG